MTDALATPPDGPGASAPAKSVDACISGLPSDKGAALTALRHRLGALLPAALLRQIIAAHKAELATGH